MCVGQGKRKGKYLSDSDDTEDRAIYETGLWKQCHRICICADATMLNLMAHEIEGDIMRNEPRVEDVRIRMDADSRPGCLFIYLDYLVRGENVRENMVFPFYLGEEPEEKSEAYETMEDDIIE